MTESNKQKEEFQLVKSVEAGEEQEKAKTKPLSPRKYTYTETEKKIIRNRRILLSTIILAFAGIIGYLNRDHISPLFAATTPTLEGFAQATANLPEPTNTQALEEFFTETPINTATQLFPTQLAITETAIPDLTAEVLPTQEAFDYTTPTEIKTVQELKKEIDNFHIVPIPQESTMYYFDTDPYDDQPGYGVLIFEPSEINSDNPGARSPGQYFEVTHNSRQDSTDPKKEYSVGKQNKDGKWVHIFPMQRIGTMKNDNGTYVKYQLANGLFIINTGNNNITFAKSTLESGDEGMFHGYDSNVRERRADVTQDFVDEKYQKLTMTWYQLQPFSPIPTPATGSK